MQPRRRLPLFEGGGDFHNQEQVDDMPTRYGDLFHDSAKRTITGIGIAPGPSGGDGWQVVSFLPRTNLPEGVGNYSLMVTGVLHNIRRIASTIAPQRGVVQLCLGLDTGAKSPLHQCVFSLNEQTLEGSGIPFGFTMAQRPLASPTISDPFFGDSFDNDSGARWCIWARVYTNGDPLTYNYEFDISDLTWIWWDTGRIPAEDCAVEAYYPASPQPLLFSQAFAHISPNQPGNAGEKWLFFGSVSYEPPIGALGSQPAPVIQLGYTTNSGVAGTVGYQPDSTLAGMVPKIGTNTRWAQSKGNIVIQNLNQGQGSVPIHSHWGFWYGERPSGSFYPAFQARDRQSSGPAFSSRIRSYLFLAIRLDNLFDVVGRYETEVVRATGNRFADPSRPDDPREGAAYVPLERAQSGIVSSPCVMAHGIVSTVGRNDYLCEIWTNRGVMIRGSSAFAVANTARNEGASIMSFAQHGLTPSSPSVQYRMRFTGGALAHPASIPVRDISVLQFNFVRDADPEPALPATPSNPIVVSPGRESPSVASLSLPPHAPDSATDESFVEPEFGDIRGATGYRRTWPLFSRPRRQFPVTWSALLESQARDVMDFLQANPMFRHSLPRDSAIAAFQIGEPELRQISAQAYAVSVDCVELIWTGP